MIRIVLFSDVDPVVSTMIIVLNETNWATLVQ